MKDDPAATETFRQRIMEILRREELSFDELRRELEVPARALEDDLRHVERSLRHGSERLRIDPARCRACGFVFRERTSRHLHAPSRCPHCRSERIAEPRFRIA
ncbi:MAG TPA: transcriptional regulator [Thermoanaerobaculia bacterium]|nr:transcriptional regulator [Thermoanaerobaculia bacterium]